MESKMIEEIYGDLYELKETNKSQQAKIDILEERSKQQDRTIDILRDMIKTTNNMEG